MPKNLTTNNQVGVAAPITEPVYLLALGFTTPIRLSSRENILYESNVYSGVEMSVVLSPPTATVRFWNEGLTHGGNMISEGPGKTATLYEVYGQGPFSDGDADIIFSGYAGQAEIDKEFVELKLVPTEPFVSPIHSATDDIFKHLPVAGTRIETRAGTFVIQRNT